MNPLQEDDVVPIPAVVPTWRLMVRRDRPTKRPTRAKTYVESVIREDEIPYDWGGVKRKTKWRNEPVTGLFLGRGFNLPHDWFTISAGSAEEAIEEFQREILNPINMSMNAALARGLVIILGPPFGKPKLAISMSRKARLSPDAKSVIWTFFKVDPRDEIDVAPGVTPDFTGDTSAKVTDLLGISK